MNRTGALPTKIRITATEGRGVDKIRLFIDEGQPLDAGLTLLRKVSAAIGTIDRATRRPEAAPRGR